MSGLLERAVVALETIAAALSSRPVTSGEVAPSTEVTKPEKPTRGSTKKPPEPETKPTPPPASPSIDYAILKKAIIDLSQVDGGRQAVLDLIASYDKKAKKASDIPAEKWEEMRDKAVAKLEELTTAKDDFA